MDYKDVIVYVICYIGLFVFCFILSAWFFKNFK